jgi:hypothetical protein
MKQIPWRVKEIRHERFLPTGLGNESSGPRKKDWHGGACLC